MSANAPDDTAAIDAARSALAPFAERGERLLLAVSGGLDSMALLHAAHASVPQAIAAVATFDHATGDAELASAALVARTARKLGLPVRSERNASPRADEAGWRDARWRFLRAAARELSAVRIATAHTRDDQVETVVLRALRDASPRGLAGLYAGAPDVLRPFVHVPRAAIDRYARAHGVAWIEDPSNRSLRHRRNRVRHELLPALRRARPAFDEDVLALAESAARWRRDVESFVDAHVALTRHVDGALHVATRSLAGYDAEALAVVWPAIAARADVQLDRRGVVRLTQFTIATAAGAPGRRIQLSGFVDVEATRGAIVLRRGNGPARAARGTQSL